MNKGIAHILMMRLRGLPFVDKYGGLVQVMEQVDILTDEVTHVERKVLKRFPVAADAVVDGVVLEGLTDFTPDDRYRGMIYFEDQGMEPLGRLGRMWRYKSRLRLVAWLNTARLTDAEGQQPLLYELPARLYAAVKEKMTALEHVNEGYYQRLNVKEKNILAQNRNIFGPYSYDETAVSYLLSPFEFFAVEYEVDFCMTPECINPITTTI